LKYVTHGLRKNATIELCLTGCDDEMVKAVSGVEMLENIEVRSGKENLRRGRRTRATALNRTGRKRECFNTCFKNRANGVLT
jgi:hypothetical protein